MKKIYVSISFTLLLVNLTQAQLVPSIEWERCYGGSLDDFANSFQQTSDRGFIMVGSSESNNGDVTGNHPNSYGYSSEDLWIVKIDSDGNIEWQKSLGGSRAEFGSSVRQTSDLGFIVAGAVWSDDGDVSGNHGYWDWWILKLSSSGILLWQKCLGGTNEDYACSLQQTNDNGFIVAGRTASSDGDVSGYHGGEDYWILRLDSIGNIEWQKCLGGSSFEMANSIEQTNDHGFIIAGWSQSNDGDVSGNHTTIEYYGDTVPTPDYWIVKLDSVGNVVWQKCFGGSGLDYAYSIKSTLDGGYIVAGSSYSNDGDVTGNHYNLYGPSIDFWIIKLDAQGNLVWQKSLGGTSYDMAFAVCQLNNGTYVAAGETGSEDWDVSGNHSSWGSDYWIVGLDTNGNMLWQECLGGSAAERATSIIRRTDSTLAVVGYSNSGDFDVSGNHLSYDFWIAKLSNDVTGVSSIITNSTNVFPNPTSTFIHINFSVPHSTTLSIFNLLGEKVKEQKVITQQVTMDVSELPAGMYVVRTEKEMIGKFVKE